MSSNTLTNQLTLAQAQETFFYDAETGCLHWKIRPSIARLWGSKAGNIKQDGYFAVTLMNKGYQFHNVVWNYHNGLIPNGFTVDHRDRDRSNNRIENLRLAKDFQQNFNQLARGFTRLRRNRKNPWRSCFIYNKSRKHLGVFATALQARLAYERHTYQVDPEFACTHFTDALKEICSGGVQTSWRPGYSG